MSVDPELDPDDPRPTPMAPLLPAAIALSCGILIDRLTQPASTLTWAVLATIGSLAAILARHHSRLASAFVLLSIAAVGGGWHHARWTDLRADDIAHALGPDSGAIPARLRGWLVSVPEIRDRLPSGWSSSSSIDQSTSVELSVVQLEDRGAWRTVSGTVEIWIAGERADLRAGDAVEVIGTLQAMEPPRNPGERDRRGRLRARGIRLSLFVSQPQSIQLINDRLRWSAATWLGALRAWSHRTLIGGRKGESAAMAATLLLGRYDGVEQTTIEAFNQTSTTHLLAISGMHLHVLALVVGAICRWLGVPWKRTLLTVAVVIVGYALLVGLVPSVVRAAVMALVVCLAGLAERPVRAANLTSLAVIATLAVNPAWLFDAGWQLSFLGVAALVWGVPPALEGCRALGMFLETRGRRWQPDDLDRLEATLRPGWRKAIRRAGWWAIELFAVSTVVWLICSPLVAWWFHISPPVGLLLNPPLIVLTSFALLLAGVVLILSSIWQPLAEPARWLCVLLLDQTTSLVRWGADRRWGTAFIPAPPFWWLCGFYLLLALVAWRHRVRPEHGRLTRVLASALVAWSLVGIGLVLTPHRPGVLEADVLAVQHGLAVVIQAPDGRALLYDCGAMRGSRVGRDTIAPALWDRGIRRLDAVILSHADADHFSGLDDLMRRFDIRAVWLTDPFAGPDNQAAVDLIERVRARGIPIQSLSAGARIDLGAGALGTVRHPAAGWLPDAPDNARSIVLDLEQFGRRALLTGDIEGAGLAELVDRPSPGYDVMLSPHHGGRSSNTDWFLEWARADQFIASQRRPDSLATDPLTPLERRGVPVWRTWRDGAVRLRWTADRIKVHGFATESRSLDTQPSPDIEPAGQLASDAPAG